jgi:hypothetical protein
MYPALSTPVIVSDELRLLSVPSEWPSDIEALATWPTASAMDMPTTQNLVHLFMTGSSFF